MNVDVSVKSNPSLKSRIAMEKISRDRTRTNLLRKVEQRSLAYLVQRIPDSISSDMLTVIGFLGSIIVFLSFLLAALINRNFLFLGIAGFFVSWFGDSLDGRLAYYRNKPRKLYGFALDITMDWLSIIIIGFGYLIYSDGGWDFLGYGFVVMYAWEMIIALMKYKITGEYSIDSGLFGPTEVRIVISAVMILEVILPGSIIYSAMVIGVLLFLFNIVDTYKLLHVADNMDTELKRKLSGDNV